MSGAEQVHQAARPDGVGAPAAGLLDGVGLRLGQARQQLLGVLDPGQRGDGLAAVVIRQPPAPARSHGSQ